MSFKVDSNNNINYNQVGSVQSSTTPNISLFNYSSTDLSPNIDSIKINNQNNIETRLKNLINQKNLSCGDELFNYLKLVLDVTLSEIEINAKINEYAPVIESLISEGIEITPDNVQLRIQQHGILLNCGWDSIESFNRANSRNSESLVERLERMYGIKVANMSTEEKAKYLNSYFDTYFSELQKKRLENASPEEAEKIKANIRKTQLTDFVKLLYNSSQEEYALFRDAIGYLAADNRYQGYNAILDSFINTDERIAFNSETTQEQLENWCINRDQLNDLPSEETIMNLTRVYNRNLSPEKLQENIGTISYQNFQEIKKEYDKLVVKIENGEKLTEEENLFFNECENKRLFFEFNAREQVNACAQSGNADDAKKVVKQLIENGLCTKEFLTDLAKDFENYSSDFKDVIYQAINQATNGNFAIVLDNIKNGTDNPLNSFEHNSTEQVENSNSDAILTTAKVSTEEVSGSIGFTQTTTVPPQIAAKQEPFVEEVAEETSSHLEGAPKRTTSIRDVLTVPGELAQKISKFVQEKGILVATSELLDSGDDACRKYAIIWMDILGEGALKVLYYCLGTVSGRGEFIKNASASVLSGLKDVDSTTTEKKKKREKELRDQGPFWEA